MTGRRAPSAPVAGRMILEVNAPTPDFRVGRFSLIFLDPLENAERGQEF
jgi:hypothetical protein